MLWGFDLNYIILISTAILALGVVWKLLRFTFKVDRALPTLLNIAAQFEENHGSSIRDKINELHHNQKVIKDDLLSDRQELKASDKIILKIAEDSRLIAETNANIVRELSATSVDDIASIKDYIHEQMHAMRNQMQQENLRGKIMNKQLDRLEKRIDMIFPLVSRHRKEDDSDDEVST